MALGALHQLQVRGIRVPDDVQVVGFDNVPEATYANPSLTTIDPHIDSYARHAVDMLIERIQGYDGANAYTHPISPWWSARQPVYDRRFFACPCANGDCPFGRMQLGETRQQASPNHRNATHRHTHCESRDCEPRCQIIAEQHQHDHNAAGEHTAELLVFHMPFRQLVPFERQ